MKKPKVLKIYSRVIEPVYTGARGKKGKARTVWYVLLRFGKEKLKLRISRAAARWLAS